MGLASDSSKSVGRGRDRLSFGRLLGFGAGGVAYNIGVDAIKNLANPVYNIILGLNPAWIGSVMMLARIWDAVTDPVVGSMSDNSRLRWGRRRPFIFLGAILSSISFPLIWMAPKDWGEVPLLLYFLISSLIFYTCFTLFSVPYMSLSLELTPDYQERTRVSAARSMFAAVSGITLAWGFRFIQNESFEDPMTGMRCLGVVIGVLLFITGVLPAIFVRERYQGLGQSQPKIGFWRSFKDAFINVHFRTLMLITVVIILGFNTFNALGIYVNTYYVYSGDLKAAATLQGWTGSVMVMSLLAGIPVVNYVSSRLGKVRALQFCLYLGIIGSIGKWFLYSPAHPYWQLLVPLFIAPCSAGFWVIVNSMKADICDCDELDAGLRREGVYAAVSSWLQKFSAALTFSLGGLVLTVIGFDQSLGGEQSSEVILALRLVFSFAPLVFFIICIALTRQLPFTRDYMLDVRRRLEERRNQV